MIKTLLNADEDPPPGTKIVVEETVLNPPLPLTPPAEPQTVEEIPAQDTAAVAAAESFENPEDAKFFTDQAENAQEPTPLSAEESVPLDEDSESLTALMSEIENLEPEEFDRLESEIENASVYEPAAESPAAPVTGTLTTAGTNEPPVEAEKTPLETPEAQTTGAPKPFDSFSTPVSVEETPEKKNVDATEPTIFQSNYTSPTTAETIRNSGLAWSAGVVLFGSVVFMMIFGWLADWMLGSSPWGLVGGIILGGIIGFIQFFRITSQIFKK